MDIHKAEGLGYKSENLSKLIERLKGLSGREK
jgi:hypothetical protein